jgi:hypothetical protein
MNHSLASGYGVEISSGFTAMAIADLPLPVPGDSGHKTSCDRAGGSPVIERHPAALIVARAESEKKKE